MRKPEAKLDFAAIKAAHQRIHPHIHRTPVLTSSRLNDASGACLFFKCENFQKGGAFKARGATNAVFSLDDTAARRGVATHSSGNHGSAVARAAKLRGIPAHIVMPSNSAKVKVRAVESYGAQIVFCEPTQAAREAACAEVIAKTGDPDSLVRKRTRHGGTRHSGGRSARGCFRSRCRDLSSRRWRAALRHSGGSEIDATGNQSSRSRTS